MNRNYTVRTRIARPIADVFEAIVSSKKLRQYFVDGASGDLEEGNTIIWHWDHYGENSVVVDTIVPNQRIELVIDSKEWEKTTVDAYDVRIIFEFEAVDNGTMLSISEQGWRTDAEGLKGSHDNCSGWTHMAMCLKSHLEHGIDLRL